MDLSNLFRVHRYIILQPLLKMVFTVPINFKNIYSTPHQGSQLCEIIKVFLKYDTKKLTITDATGGIGGNALLFCKYFGFVNIIEINKFNTQIIKKNLEQYNNKTIINGNYVELFTKIKQDIVFIDPPWGENYKKVNNINLFINEININNIISILYEHSKLVFIKAPKNFLPNKTNKWNISILKIYSTNGIKHIYNIVVYYK